MGRLDLTKNVSVLGEEQAKRPKPCKSCGHVHLEENHCLAVSKIYTNGAIRALCVCKRKQKKRG